MKWISKTDAIRRADKYATRELKVPGILLMEAAARQVALRLQKLCTKQDDILFLAAVVLRSYKTKLASTKESYYATQ